LSHSGQKRYEYTEKWVTVNADEVLRRKNDLAKEKAAQSDNVTEAKAPQRNEDEALVLLSLLRATSNAKN
jgi:hypothetical protein